MRDRAVSRAVVSALLVAVASSLRAEESASQKAMKRFEAAHPGVLHTGGEVKPPKLVRRVEPQFPKKARLKFREFSPIMLAAVITEAGDVLDLTIVMSEHPDVDSLVLDAIRQWKYEPARRKGKPVAVFLTVTVLLEPAPAFYDAPAVKPSDRS